MSKLHPGAYRTALAAALLCSAAPVFAQQAAPAPAPPVTLGPGPGEDNNFFTRLYHAYADEWGLGAYPTDPNAPPASEPARRPPPFPLQAEPQPPFPFIDWPQGGNDYIGSSQPNAVDSPLMRAIGSDNIIGKSLNDAHVQIYGWINPGGNVSSSKTGFGANYPAAYAFTPNIIQLDQAVVYIERIPDTVQKTYTDWGFRIAPIYGESYRYTQSFNFPGSDRLLYHNAFAGFDMPMLWVEAYIPKVGDIPLFEGFEVRVGRFISIPDIEAQLAPNNYMYSHSMTYGYDNYTNQGIINTLQVTNNWAVQFGVYIGTETGLYNLAHVNLINPVTGFQGYNGKQDPGAQPTFAGSIQYRSDDNYNALYLTVDGHNNGQWGYNNLQWQGGTFYHKFDEHWHISMEAYYQYQLGVTDVLQGYGNTPFAYLNPVTRPFEAVCPHEAQGQTKCTAREYTALFYLNYSPEVLDNFSLRGEFLNDENGQRTGTATRYFNQAVGWQHWFSPQIEVRPEVAWYHSLDKPAFDNAPGYNGAGLANPVGKHAITIVSGDLIFHF